MGADYCCYIPEGVIINILKRVHVTTLLRCTCVCKSWYNLITSHEFISTHLNFTKKNAPLLVLIRRRFRKTELYTLHSDDINFDNYKLNFPFKSMNTYFTIIGSCNGLLCLSDDRVFCIHRIFIWNPFVKKSVLLPKPNSSYDSFPSFMQSLGFGYDRIADDYKVVWITYMEGDPKIELYKLSSGVWQDISYLRLEYLIYGQRRQVYIHGASHWLAYHRVRRYDLIVLFDMCEQVFREMRLPDSLASMHPKRNKNLVVYMESLALITWGVYEVIEPRNFCVWVMKEYGVEHSWTKHFSIDFHSLAGGLIFSRPLWFRESCGEFIAVCTDQDRRLISYGEEQGIRDLGLRCSKSDHYLPRSVHVDSFTKSLVLLDRGPDFCDAVTCTKFPFNLPENDQSSGSDSDYDL